MTVCGLTALDAAATSWTSLPTKSTCTPFAAAAGEGNRPNWEYGRPYSINLKVSSVSAGPSYAPGSSLATRRASLPVPWSAPTVKK